MNLQNMDLLGLYQGAMIVPAGLSGVKAIAAGYSHIVALKTDGTVVAWGAGSYGQTTTPAGLCGVAAIAAGGFQTLALMTNATVVAWGDNYSGQTNVPAGLSGVMAIASGGDHVAALKTNGTVVAWGANYSGQTNIPSGLSGVTDIAAGYTHTVALKTNGTVVAWGRNDYGQTNVPVGLSGVMAIAAGLQHTAVLKTNGTVVVWGRNNFGQTIVPAGLSDVKAIASGGDHILALVIKPVAITQQPQSVTVNVTSNATFSVASTGTAPLSYQWSINGLSLSGATSASFALTNLQTDQAGNYAVTITNSISSVTSSVALLTVHRLAQAISFGSLLNKQADDAPFNLVAAASSGLPVSYTSSDPSVATVSGITVTITGVGNTTIMAMQAGNATYLPAANLSQTLKVDPLRITSQPASVTLKVTSNATFSVTATAASPLSYHWRKNTVKLSGATNASLTLSNVQTNQAGNYTVVVTNLWGSMTSSVAVLTVNRWVQTLNFGSLPGKRAGSFVLDS